MFVEANSFRKASRGPGDIRRIVVHTAEIQEHRDSAEDVAKFFANPTTKTSAHVCIDNTSIVECVKDEDVAFHALGDNDATLGAELSGFAGQTKAQWEDDYSDRVVERFARWAAGKCHTYGISPRWLTAGQERARASGFVTHKIVSDVFGEGIRSDPGQFFPYDKCMERVKFHLAKFEQVRFVLKDKSGGTVLATSIPAQVGAEEADRLVAFFGNHLDKTLKDLQQDGVVVLARVKA